MVLESLNDEENDYKIINSVLTASHNVCCRRDRDNNVQPRKTYLSDNLNTMAMWNEASKWKYWMYQVIEDR